MASAVSEGADRTGEKPERAARGRFAKGNAGGPGRPRKPSDREYREALTSAVSPRAFRRICRAALKAAEEGDHQARELLTRYLLGEPRGGKSGGCQVNQKRAHELEEWAEA
jgi:hypothetical protein